MGTPRAIYCLGRQISCFSQSARVPFLLWCCSFYFRQHNVRICSFHNAEHIQHQDFLFRRSLLLLLHAALESNWGHFKFRLLSTGAFLQYKDHIDSGVTEVSNVLCSLRVIHSILIPNENADGPRWSCDIVLWHTFEQIYQILGAHAFDVWSYLINTIGFNVYCSIYFIVLILSSWAPVFMIDKSTFFPLRFCSLAMVVRNES